MDTIPPNASRLDSHRIQNLQHDGFNSDVHLLKAEQRKLNECQTFIRLTTNRNLR